MGVLAAAVFLPLLGRRDIATSHEARVAQTARLMANSGWPWNARPVAVAPAHLVHHGPIVRLESDPRSPPVLLNPWLVPILDGEIRLQKPPLPYWCAAVLFRLAGVGEMAARLIPAILGMLAAFLLYDLTRLLFGRRAAWCAALIWVSSYFIPDAYRKAMADPYLAFFTLLCVWAWVGGATGNLKSQIYHLLLFYVSLALGLLAKGPVMPADLAIPLVAYHVCFRRPVPGRWWAHVLGIALLLGVALPWPLHILARVPNVRELWRYESIGELSDNTENARPWWFYFPNLLLLALPWMGVWIAGLIFPFVRTRRRRQAFFPLAWYGVSVLFFSFIHLKKNQYLLPALPAQAMFAGVALAAILAWARRTHVGGVPGSIIVIQVCIGIGFGLALPVLLGQMTSHWFLATLLGLLGLGVALYPAKAMLQGRAETWLVAQSVAYALLLLLFAQGYVTPQDNLRSARRIAPEVMAAVEEPHRTLLVSKVPEEAAWYLPLGMRYDPWKPHVLVLVDDQTDVRSRQRLGHPPTPKVPGPSAFARWFPDAEITQVQRLPIPEAPGDARWKLYEIVLDRRRMAAR